MNGVKPNDAHDVTLLFFFCLQFYYKEKVPHISMGLQTN